METQAKSQQALDINTHPRILKELAYENAELARIVATNPSTPPDLLAALSGHQHDPELQKNVTENPNTSVEELLSLGAKFPRQLLDNPVFPLLVLENPRLFQEMPDKTLISLIGVDDISEEYLAMAADSTNSYVLHIIANHKKAPKQALSKIVNNPKMQKEAYIASQHINYAGEMNEDWDEEAWQAIKKYTFVRRIQEKEEFLWNVGVLDERLLLSLLPSSLLNIAANPETPTHVVQRIVETFDSETQNLLNLDKASNPNTPTNVLEELFNTKTIPNLVALAQNPNTPFFILEKLAYINDPKIQHAIYCNYNTPEPILKILYQDEDIAKLIKKDAELAWQSILQSLRNVNYPQSRIYFSKSITKNICIYLSLVDDIPETFFRELITKKYSSIDLLIALARHHQTPKGFFKDIYFQSKSRQQDFPKTKIIKTVIKMLIAKNAQTPVEILLRLVEDTCSQVRNAAIIHLQTNFALYNQQVAEFLDKWRYSNNVQTASETLSEIANSKSIVLCSAVAQNFNTSAKTLQKLTFHKSHDVLIAVAKNPNTSVNTLLTLSRKRKGFLHIRAHAVKTLIQKDPEKAGAVLAEFVSSREPSSPRFILLLSKWAPVEFLAEHSNSTSWLERYAIAQNPNTPQSVLEKLTQDANRIVRATARAKLTKN
jgi:hypothetical protein